MDPPPVICILKRGVLRKNPYLRHSPCCLKSFFYLFLRAPLRLTGCFNLGSFSPPTKRATHTRALRPDECQVCRPIQCLSCLFRFFLIANCPAPTVPDTPPEELPLEGPGPETPFPGIGLLPFGDGIRWFPPLPTVWRSGRVYLGAYPMDENPPNSLGPNLRPHLHLSLLPFSSLFFFTWVLRA